jgi:hypothetical protein
MTVPASYRQGGPWVHTLAKGKGKGAGQDDGGKGKDNRAPRTRSSETITIKMRQRSKSPGGTSWASARDNSQGSNRSHKSIGGGRDAKGVRRKPLGGYYCREFMNTGICSRPGVCKGPHLKTMQQWKDKKEYERGMSAIGSYKREYNKSTKKTWTEKKAKNPRASSVGRSPPPQKTT